ncbi:MAG: iron chelate uptake ABC transporter family permease subunit [Betaproteobacteria bacterium]|jgi:iron complex transport system permease protein|uniref:Putative ABC-type transport system, permease component n=1 Tax=Thiomonas delicata TaxID=364030 RepID=A0A238D7X1_THIDL|nr:MULTISPECIES: iron chelate uptake ABC transporter family permease subunit [Thiomonas]MDE2129957.1 iron chelate uptake ABC transporter family permease subunit [Betaproteobacteria bacterium]OZB43398.1 MAG: ABC transporter permease [Thiomonas sp. 15-66-11]OZB57810.1 MAG: ABC transporter permease [Thiomonas sp. 13-66-29]SBP89234.1 putative ABC-type transport system, permease component [Thiomonas delicata]
MSSPAIAPTPELPGRRLEPHDLRLLAVVGGASLLALLLGIGVGAGGWNWLLIEQLRLPRVLAGAGAGALLAEAGLAMQLVLRNPLADPYVLGASAGAGMGAIAMLVAFGSQLWLGSVGGALAALGLLLLLGRKAMASPDDEAPAQLILIGAMLSAVFGAGSTLLLALVPEQSLRGAVFWLVGDLSGARFGHWLCLLALVLALALAASCRALDRLALGSEHAWLLGEPVHRLRLGLVLLAALATGAAVAEAGAVGFVGLVVPHVLRMFGVVRMRQQSWAVPLLGAALVVAADALARGVAMPYELPVGAITALLGAPVFIVLLIKQPR